MAKSKFSEDTILAALSRLEQGMSVEELAIEMGVSRHTVYAWKYKFGAPAPAESHRISELEDENLHLRNLVADLSLEKEMLKSMLLKKNKPA